MNKEFIKHMKLIVFALLVMFIQTSTNAQSIFGTIQNGNYTKVEQMIRENKGWVDSIASGYSPLLYASVLGKDSIVHLLLQNGANINYKRPSTGWNAVHYTVATNKSSTLRLLINNGANINSLTNDHKTALHMATYYGYYDLCSFLIANKCQLNVQDTSGRTPLHIAIEVANLKSDRISKFLINAGADFNLHTNTHKSAIILAIENNCHAIVDLLQQKGAELPQDKEGMNSLLHSAVLNGFQDISEKLVANGADLTSLDNKGRNLLHNAALVGNLTWVRKLVDMGWDLNITDYTQRTAATLANDWGFNDVVQFLKANGGVLSKPNMVEIAGAEKSEIKVSYIANMGFMLSSASKTVMIDALFGTSFSYVYPSALVVDKINQLVKPFNSVDLMLITHAHYDHFSAPMVAAYLSNNNNVKVVCNKPTLSALKGIENHTLDTTRIIGLTPDLYKSTDTIVNNIAVKILRLRHTGANGRDENLGFIFNLDGINVLHIGDATGRVWERAVISGIEEFDSIGFGNLDVDIAILNRGFLWGEDAPGIEIIEKYIKPKHIILGHFSIGHKDGEDEVLRTIEKLKDRLPGISILEESMQSIIIKNNQTKTYPNSIGFNRKFNPHWQQLIPGDTAEIFLPEIVSLKGKNTHACTFSPDGKQLYFSRYPDRKSFVMTFENGQWSNPQEAFFNGKETSISSSNEKIFYYRNGDIYFNKKTEEAWGNAINVGRDINTVEMEYYPSVTDDGTLFFSRNGNWNKARIMYSTFKNAKYTPLVDIGSPVNDGGASHAYVAPDKSYMIFNSPRKGSYTNLDLWISFRNEIGIWSNPQNLGKRINSGGDAILCPTVSPDGNYLFFNRLQKDGTGYIYWVSTKFINQIKK